MVRGWGPALTNEKHILRGTDLFLNWCPFPYADEKSMALKKKYVEKNKLSAMPILPVRLLMLGASLMNFLRYKHLYTYSIVYEDMMSNTKVELEKMYNKLDIPTELVSKAMEALKVHSQRGVFTNNVLVRSKGGKIFTDSDWEICDSLFEDLGLPIKQNMSIEDLRNLMKL